MYIRHKLTVSLAKPWTDTCWILQIIGSIVISLLLDSPNVKRRTRACLGWGTLLAIVSIVHIWAYFYQR
jgi:hypothetical protein